MTPTTSKRRLFGLDRSGPKPSVTRRGQPLHPLTIPNLVGYVRLAAIPVFLYLALSSSDGRTAASAILYLAIAGSDYLDGFLARATGQYSRMGALLDPLVDRLTVLAGVVVCWKFELLPRWALAILAVRELLTLIVAQLGLRRGLDLEINWVGRWSVWLTMGGIFLALVTAAWIAPAMFFAGLVGSLLASALYLRTGLAAMRRDEKSRPAQATEVFLHGLNLNLTFARRAYNRRAANDRGSAQLEDTFPDVSSMSDKELKELIDQLTDEEREVSYRRRLLHGKIDILRAELVNRLRAKREAGDTLISGDDVQQLTDILAGKVPQHSEEA